MEIQLEVGPSADVEELDDATRRVRRDLLDLNDVHSVERPSIGSVPAGARAVDVAAVGALIATVVSGAKPIADVMNALLAWVRRDASRTARLSIDGDVIELTGISEADQERLISIWVSRHARD